MNRTHSLRILTIGLLSLFGFYPSQSQTPVDNYILQKLQAYGFPGMAICYIKDGKVAFADGYGRANVASDIPFTANTIMEVASISKTITATAAMILWEQGAFELHDPIDDYIPLLIRNPFYPDDPITIHMLLNHSSSINFGSTLLDSQLTQIIVPPGQADSFEQFLIDHMVPGGKYYIDTVAFRPFRPGTGYSYSNFSMTILAWIVERLAGMPFHQFCNENIFEPLCMESTAWYYSELDTNIVARNYPQGNWGAKFSLHEWSEYPGVGLKSTVIDISRFMAMHLNYGELDGVRIIDSTTEVVMRNPHFVVQDAVIPHDNQAILIRQQQCYGMDLISETLNNNFQYYGKSGQDWGLCTRTYFVPTYNAVITGFINSNIGDGINLPLIDILLELRFIPPDSISLEGKVDLDCEAYHPCQQEASDYLLHPDDWPINAHQMNLGTKEKYTKDELLALLAITDTEDASILLAQSLITAKLNIARATELRPILATVNAAMSLIGEERLPFTQPVSISSQQGQEMLAIAASLNDYNAGALNEYECSGTISSSSDLFSNDDEYDIEVFPNPMRTSGFIRVLLAKDEDLVLDLGDLNGHWIQSIVREKYPSGEHMIAFDVSKLQAGVYLLSMKAGRFYSAQKVIVVK